MNVLLVRLAARSRAHITIDTDYDTNNTHIQNKQNGK